MVDDACLDRAKPIVKGRLKRAGPRAMVHYPDLGLAVEHRRIDDLGDAIIPPWLESALA